MKELSIEKKAKRYDEALERMKSWARGEHPECFTEAQKAAEFIFPELKEESEDERIRKEMIDFFKGFYDNLNVKAVDVEPWIAWLEKQGEQKPADKVKPKFNEDDWVVSDLDRKARQISEVHFDEYNSYYVVDGKSVNLEEYDRLHHLWTIQDAKDGDVLVIQKTDVTYETIFIFNKIKNNRIIQYLHYFTTDSGEEVCEARSINGFLGFVGTTVYPATKEQRDTLMKAMAGLGYEWDAEKKELKKIKQKRLE